jgi:hypothetical protein
MKPENDRQYWVLVGEQGEVMYVSGNVELRRK